MTFEYSQEISDDYEKLFKSEKDYDVIIYVGENDNVKELYAHSLILCIRSQYFCGALSNKWVEKRNGKFIFKKPNISPQLFKVILRFIYCGKIDFTELQVPETLNLLMAVDELNIQTLISCIQEYLIKSQETFLQENLPEILQTVYQHEPFNDLLNYCLEKIEVIFHSDKFINLDTPLLEFLLRHDDLNLDEIDIWESLIKWGLAQEQTINRDVTKWCQEDFTTFSDIICEFIPLIRFHGISSEDYFNKVKPYEKIFSKELRDENLKFYMVPGSEPGNDLLPRRSFDSILINQKHIVLFANWIDRKDESSKHIITPYRFNLLYRASRDGKTAAAFHDRCDYKGATIAIAKIANSERIVGGFNPLNWDSSSGWVPAKDSFIFSFTDRNDFQTAKVGYINNDTRYSIYCYQSYGPAFGGGHDLYQHNCTWKSYINSYSYSKIDIPANSNLDGNYRVLNEEDYEVFQVIKK